MPFTALTDSFFHYGYIGIFFLTAFGSTYVPFSGGLVVMAAGALSKSGQFNFFLVLATVAAASTFADLLIFRIARRIGRNSVYQRYIKNHPFSDRIERNFNRRPEATVLFSRFIGIATTPVDALAGLAHMKTSSFLLFDFIGNTICCLAYLSVGYFIGRAIEIDAQKTGIAIAVLAIALLIAYGIYIFFFKTQELPDS